MSNNPTDVNGIGSRLFREKGGAAKSMTTAELLAANGLDVDKLMEKLVVETFDVEPQQGWLNHFLHQSRPVTLSPGLRSVAEVREDLLAAIERRAEHDVSDEHRQGTTAWSERVKAMPDEQLWFEYVAQWGDSQEIVEHGNPGRA